MQWQQQQQQQQQQQKGQSLTITVWIVCDFKSESRLLVLFHYYFIWLFSLFPYSIFFFLCQNSKHLLLAPPLFFAFLSGTSYVLFFNKLSRDYRGIRISWVVTFLRHYSARFCWENQSDLLGPARNFHVGASFIAEWNCLTLRNISQHPMRHWRENK